MFNPYFLSYTILFSGLIALGSTIALLGPVEAQFLLGEAGPIERASALGYFLCAGYMLASGGGSFVKKYSYIIVLILLFGCRELDFDKRFTTMGILKSRFYLSPDVGVLEKVIGLFIIALLLWAIFKTVKHHAASTLSGLTQLTERAIGVVAIFGLLVVSKSIDGLARKLEPFGIETSAEVSFVTGAAEEVMELGIPILMIIVFHSWLQNRNE